MSSKKHRSSTSLGGIIVLFTLSLGGGIGAALLPFDPYLKIALAFLSGVLLGISAEKLLTLRLRRLTENIESLLS